MPIYGGRDIAARTNSWCRMATYIAIHEVDDIDHSGELAEDAAEVFGKIGGSRTGSSAADDGSNQVAVDPWRCRTSEPLAPGGPGAREEGAEAMRHCCTRSRPETLRLELAEG